MGSFSPPARCAFGTPLPQMISCFLEIPVQLSSWMQEREVLHVQGGWRHAAGSIRHPVPQVPRGQGGRAAAPGTQRGLC